MAVFTNKAVLDFAGGSVESNVVTGEITEALSAEKTAISDVYGNDPVVYVVSLVNDGGSAYQGLTLEDDLGAYLFGEQTVYPLSYVDGSVTYFVNGVLQSDPAVNTENGLTIGGISVPAGGNAVIIYAAQPTEFAPRGADASVSNRAVVTGGGLSAAVEAEATVAAEQGIDLSVVKSLTPVVVSGNDTVEYTFVIENRGSAPADASAALVLNDTFDPALTDIEVTLNSQPLNEGTGYTYDPATGEFSTVTGVITVPAATFPQNPDTGAYDVLPGSATLIVTGRI